jgi:hypothetical protein
MREKLRFRRFKRKALLLPQGPIWVHRTFRKGLKEVFLAMEFPLLLRGNKTRPTRKEKALDSMRVKGFLS